jgi:two-component system response regulator FlrC
MTLAWRLQRASGEGISLHHTLDGAVYLIRDGKLDEATCIADSVLAAGSGDASVSGRAHSFKGEVASIRGALDETMREYALAIADLERTPLAGSLARARRGRAEAFFNLSMYTSALEESEAARLLIDSIGDSRVRRRAALESALCEGLIRLELNEVAAGRLCWETAGKLLASDSDPLLVGQHDVLGGLALVAVTADRRRGFALLERACAHFLAHGLIYYRARALEAHGRRLLAEDWRGAVERVEEAAQLFRRVGASLRESGARRWLESSYSRGTAQGGADSPGPVAQPVDRADGILLAGPSTRALVDLATSAAASGSTVLITGESGTGKELFARLLHTRSRRAARPWVPFNCAAVPAEMIESTLFGHRRGAFTGALASHNGLVREADGGTFFLDELGELPLSLQAKLLRFLQEGEILPLGECRAVHVDVRIVAATNRDLEREAREGRFREDLFHRLNVIRLQIAPLRDRRDEIPPLARHLVATIGARLSIRDAELTAGAIGPLLAHHWPGNVRELANVLERALALYGSTITRESVLSSLAPPTGAIDPAPYAGPRMPSFPAKAPMGLSLEDAMRSFERTLIEQTLDEFGGNRSRSAHRLGVSLQRLRYRMRRLGLG